MYVEHPAGWQTGNFSRQLDKKVGWWSEAKWDPSRRGVTAVLNLFSKEANPQPWLEGMIRESIAAGRPGLGGVSMFAGGKWKLVKEADGPSREAVEISQWWSADAVAEPSAGGEPISLVESEQGDTMDPKDMTLEQLQKALEAHPEFAESLRPLIEAKTDPPTPTKEDPPTPPAPTASAIAAESQHLLAPMREEREAVQRERAAMTLDRLLAES